MSSAAVKEVKKIENLPLILLIVFKTETLEEIIE